MSIFKGNGLGGVHHRTLRSPGWLKNQTPNWLKNQTLPTIVQDDVDFSLGRVARLHARLHEDSHCLRKYERHSAAALPAGIAGVIIAGGALISGFLATPRDGSWQSLLLIVGIPAVTALAEMGFFCILAVEERKLKRMYDMYNRGEY